MSSLRRDTLLNLVGSGAPLLVAVVTIPSLLKDLGDGKDRRSAYRDGQLRLPVPGPVR